MKIKNCILAAILSCVSVSMYGQFLTVSLANPVSVTTTQLKWDIMVQNTTAGGSPGAGVMTIATANLPQRTTLGTIAPSASMPLTIVKEPDFVALNFTPQVQTVSSQTVLRFNGGAAPAMNPVVPTGALTKLGTVTFNSLNPMTFPVNIGSTIATPNISVSGTLDGVVTTFSLSTSNLLIPQAANAAPLMFSAPLPIKISDLSAFAQGKRNAIKWSTSSEYNNDVQIVEASNDGILGWRTIAKVKSKNSATGGSYEAFDTKPSLLTYYRIRSIDFDGQEQYSEVVSVLRESIKTSRLRGIAPIPADGFITADIELAAESDVTYRIIDVSGRELISKAYRMNEGNNSVRIDISTYPAGTYTLVVTGEDLRASEQFIKQ